MEFSDVLGAVTGEMGVIALLLLSFFLILNGRLFPKQYVEDLKEINERLTKTSESQAISISKLAETQAESLENSRTTLRLIKSARKVSERYVGVDSDELD